MVVEFRAAAIGGKGAPGASYIISDGRPVRALKDGTFQLVETGEILHRL